MTGRTNLVVVFAAIYISNSLVTFQLVIMICMTIHVIWTLYNDRAESTDYKLLAGILFICAVAASFTYAWLLATFQKPSVSTKSGGYQVSREDNETLAYGRCVRMSTGPMEEVELSLVAVLLVLGIAMIVLYCVTSGSSRRVFSVFAASFATCAAHSTYAFLYLLLSSEEPVLSGFLKFVPLCINTFLMPFILASENEHVYDALCTYCRCCLACMGSMCDSNNNRVENM